MEHQSANKNWGSRDSNPGPEQTPLSISKVFLIYKNLWGFFFSFCHFLTNLLQDVFKVQEIFLFLQFLQLSRKWKISRNHGLNLFRSFLHSKVEMKAHDKRRLNNLLLNFSLTPKYLWENPEFPDVSDIIVGALLGL